MSDEEGGITKRAIIVGRFGVPADVFDYLDTEARALAFGGLIDWEFGRFWPDSRPDWYGISCLIRCKKQSISFEIGPGPNRLITIGGDLGDPIYQGPLTLESAQSAVMVLKIMEDDDRLIP